MRPLYALYAVPFTLTLFVIPTAYTLLARQRFTPAVDKTVYDAEASAALPR